jgi:hypothetical protein
VSAGERLAGRIARECAVAIREIKLFNRATVGLGVEFKRADLSWKSHTLGHHFGRSSYLFVTQRK